jgi:hypothetical protein
MSPELNSEADKDRLERVIQMKLSELRVSDAKQPQLPRPHTLHPFQLEAQVMCMLSESPGVPERADGKRLVLVVCCSQRWSRR